MSEDKKAQPKEPSKAAAGPTLSINEDALNGAIEVLIAEAKEQLVANTTDWHSSIAESKEATESAETMGFLVEVIQWLDSQKRPR